MHETSGPVLETRRLILRPWSEADLGPFAALNADAEVMAHLPARLARE
jgi:RimJ/RimL family protein N-acetyltransferase